MAAAAREQKELLALMHQQLVGMGYESAAKELLEQSGQKSFPPAHISLKEIFTQWKKTFSQLPKQKTVETKTGTPVRIRIPDAKSSSESSEEEEAAQTLKTNLPVNSSTKPTKTATREESSSEDSDSSSEDEEEAVAKKTEKNPVAGNKTEFLQPADQNTNSVPGKGEQNKSASDKPLPAAARKAGPNKGFPSKAGPPSQSLISGGQKTTPTTKTAESSESSSSSSSSESEEETTLTPVNVPLPKTTLKKAVSARKDSSDDSDSEDGTKAPRQQIKAAVQNFPVNSPLLNKSPVTPGSCASSTVRVTPAKHPSAKSGNANKSPESTDTSETTDSSDNEAKAPASVSQRLPTPQPSVGTKQNRANQPGILPKAAPGALKEKEASNESGSSSDSEDESDPTPAPSVAKATQAVQSACAVKAQPPKGSHLKTQQSEDSSEDSSDDSDSEEDRKVAQKPAPVTRKPAATPVKNVTAKNAGLTSSKPQSAGKGGTTSTKSGTVPVPKASENSDTSSSDSSDSKEDVKPAKQPPIHPFFKQMTGKAAIPSGKGVQANLNTSNAASNTSQSPAAKATGKEGQIPFQKTKPSQGQALGAKSSGISPDKKSSSDSSSDSSEEEAEAVTTTKHLTQPATQQKQDAEKESESSSEESSDEEQEASQSLLKGSSGSHKIQVSTVAAGPLLSKQGSGKTNIPTVSAQKKPSGKPASADSTSSSESSSSDTEAEETITPKTEITSLPLSGKEAAAAKGKRAGKRGLESTGSKPPSAKKAAAKVQSNGQAQQTPKVQEDAQASTVAKAKTSKAGKKEKPSKKRKLADGDAEVSKGKKLKMQGKEEIPIKKKKKKNKSKSSDSVKSAKKKDGKEKKSDKKKKKSKNAEKVAEDGSQKKKKKKKKMDNLQEET